MFLILDVFFQTMLLQFESTFQLNFIFLQAEKDWFIKRKWKKGKQAYDCPEGYIQLI